MPKRKKSKKHFKAMPYVILVELTSKEEFDESWENILSKKKKVGFKIEDILSTSIPTVRARNHPVQM
jgi:hypothetical protein